MPFLFHTNDQFTVVDDKSKQGLYIQLYTKGGFLRPIQLAPSPILSYSALLDEEDVLHGVFKNNKNQIYAFEYTPSSMNRTLLLEDAKQIYHFSHLNLAYFNKHLYFFYMAQKPNTETYSLLYQLLDKESSDLNTLVSDLNCNTLLKCLTSNDALYIFYTKLTEQYDSLNCIKLTSQTESFTLVLSELPIIDFNVCIHNDTLHVVYARDVYGKEQIVYMNASHNYHMPLTLSSNACRPCIIFYGNALWINYMDNNILNTLLSIDEGASFSGPSPCSLQNHLNTYSFSSQMHPLATTTLYASLFNTLRIPPICTLDIEGIHPDLAPNRELDLLLQSTHTKMSATSFSPQTVSVSSTPPQSVPSPTKTRSIKSAAQAFMNECNGFDATPLK